MAGNDKRDFGRETRDTVVKSSLTGVGVTVLAVAALSPAGFGGMIGTSVASAFGNEHATTAPADPYAKLPPFPNLLSRGELDDIQGQLAATTAAMEITRAATEDRIELVRELALTPNALSIARLRHVAKSDTVAPARAPRPGTTVAPASTQAAPVASVTDSVPTAPVQDSTAAPEVAPTPSATPMAPISFADSPVDSDLELASLLFGDY